MSLIDDLRDQAGTVRDTAQEKLSDVLTALERPLGSRTRAKVALGAGAAAVVLVAGLGLSQIPLTAAPTPEQTAPVETTDEAENDDAPADDTTEDDDEVTAPGGVGSGVSAKDRADEAKNKNVEENVPDEAKTVRELANERIVEARVTGVVDGTHLTCELVNGDSVTVRLIGVTPTDSCILQAGDAIPYDLVRDQRSVYLERDDITQEDDGTWPRYLWTSDPRSSTAVDAVPWQAYGCRPDVGWFTYTPEDGLDRYKTTFEAQETWGVDLTAEAEKKRQEELEREWAERKEEQERLEAEQDGASATGGGAAPRERGTEGDTGSETGTGTGGATVR